MNNRFKFRAYWHNDVFNEWQVYENPELITGDGTCLVFNNSESGADEWRENVILCQCTGLKDKNGKLIYEGDIVKDDYYDYLHYVKWNYNGWHLFPCIQNKYVIGLIDDKTKVIGNIYENPELLEE